MESKRETLYKIHSEVGEVGCYGENRTEPIIMSRIRIRHNKLNNTLNITGTHATSGCTCGETVEHVREGC